MKFEVSNETSIKMLCILSKLKTLLLSTILAVFLFSCNSGNSANTDIISNDLPVLSLQTRNIEVPKTYVCDIQAVQFVEIRAKVEGFVDKIYVDEGQLVRKGQPLFQLTSMEFTEMVNSANAKLMQARAEAKSAAVEVERMKVLVDKNIISNSELELARSKKLVAESVIQEAEAQLQNAKTSLSYATIKAPFDGIVDRIMFKSGSLVTAGDLLTNITDISEIFAYYKVNENEYLTYMREKLDSKSNKKNEELTLILSDGQEYVHKGKLETMEADFEKGTGSIAFRVRFPNPEKLIKHGASGKIQMTTLMPNVFLIPQKSTFEIQDYNYVYLVDKNNTVKVRSFKPIQRFGQFYVAEGFQEGDRIIYEGIQQVKDGMVIGTVSPLTEEEVYDSLSNPKN
jgi:membrane fusion protein, multidrug efflux system